MKEVSFDDIEIGDIIILIHKNGKETITGELIEKYKSEGWNNIISGGDQSDPRKWVMERYIPDSWFFTVNGQFESELYPDKNCIAKIGASSRWYDCHVYDKKC